LPNERPASAESGSYRFAEVCTTEIRLAEISFAKIHPMKFGFAEVRLTEVYSFKVYPTEAHSAKVRFNIRVLSSPFVPSFYTFS